MWKYSILAIVLAATPAMAGGWAADVIARLPVQIAEIRMAEAHCDIDVPEKYETMVTELGARFLDNHLGARFLDNHKVDAIIDGADVAFKKLPYAERKKACADIRVKMEAIADKRNPH